LLGFNLQDELTSGAEEMAESPQPSSGSPGTIPERLLQASCCCLKPSGISPKGSGFVEFTVMRMATEFLSELDHRHGLPRGATPLIVQLLKVWDQVIFWGGSSDQILNGHRLASMGGLFFFFAQKSESLWKEELKQRLDLHSESHLELLETDPKTLKGLFCFSPFTSSKVFPTETWNTGCVNHN
jgi:hypothetical protein